MMKCNLTHILLLTTFVGCSTFQGPSHEVKLQQSSVVTYQSGEKVKVEKDKTVPLNKGPLLVESPGHLGVLVVPVREEDQKVDLRLKKLDKDNFGEQIQAIYNRELSEILGGVYKVQKMIHENKKRDALSEVQKLQVKYPGLTYLSFLEASVYLILGNKAKTKQILEVALTNYPDNKEAMDLYVTLLDKGETNRFLKK